MIDKILQPILNIVKFHKKKLLLLLGLYSIFLYFVFPFNDLGDLVSQRVSELTNGQVFVSFDTLDLRLIPHPGIALSNVSVETPFTPRLNAKALSLAPNIAGLLSFKPGVSAHAEKLLGGDVDLFTRGGEKTPAGKLKQKISLDLTKINMLELSEMAQLPMRITGSLNGSLDSQIDLDFVEQPVADLDIKMEKVQVPESQVNTPMGPMPLPQMNLYEIIIAGKAEKGSIDISRFIVGRPGGDFYANVTGKLDMKLEKGLGNNVTPRFGGYDLNVRMQVGEEFKNKMGSYLGLLQPYQSAPNTYAFRVSGINFYGPPNLARLQ